METTIVYWAKYAARAMDMLSLVEALSALLERILGENHVGLGCLRKAATLACSSSRTCVYNHSRWPGAYGF